MVRIILKTIRDPALRQFRFSLIVIFLIAFLVLSAQFIYLYNCLGNVYCLEKLAKKGERPWYESF